MKTFCWPLRVFLFVCLTQTIACTKTVNTSAGDSLTIETSDNLTFPVSNEFADCKIRNIIHEHPGIGGLTVNGLFTYHKGNPISLTYSNDGTGNPNHLFFYDKQGKLKEWRVTYFPEEDGDFAEYRHLYGYSGNRIVTDTLIYDEDVNPIVFISTLTYDEQGRIIKENIRNTVNPDESFPYPTRNPTYTYDARGNLAVKGWKSSSYDNKVSIFRSHPVFQFIFRNYSKNNAAPETKYNAKGLPNSVKSLNDTFFNCSPGDDAFERSGMRVQYDCQ